MRIFSALIAGVLALLQTLPALAQCKIRSGLSDFGSLAFGVEKSKIPFDWEHPQECFEVKVTDFRQCPLADRGIKYFVSDEVGVSRKDIATGMAGVELSLPLGFTTDDTITKVIDRLNARGDAPRELEIVYEGGRAVVSTGLCLIDANGAEFAVSFVFGADETLESISAYMNAPEI